jgi:hypothetical protein
VRSLDRKLPCLIAIMIEAPFYMHLKEFEAPKWTYLVNQGLVSLELD